MSDSWWEPADVVPSEKVKGFCECSHCHGILYPAWAADKRKWNYCPLCGRELRKENDEGKNS